MCLSIPGEIIEINENMAKVSIGGTIYDAGTHLMDNLQIGDYVLLHTGYIIQKLSKEEAEENIKYLKELGEIDKEIRDGEQ